MLADDRKVGLAARGLFADLITLAYHCDEDCFGTLVKDGKRITMEAICEWVRRGVGATGPQDNEMIADSMEELRNEQFVVTRNGEYHLPDLEAMAKLSAIRSKVGAKGGNPVLLGKDNGNER